MLVHSRCPQLIRLPSPQSYRTACRLTRSLPWSLLCLGFLNSTATVALGQTDRMYIVDAQYYELWMVESGQVLDYAPLHVGQHGVAVSNTVWTSSYSTDGCSYEYDLDGYATGLQQLYTSVNSVDATTDGEYVYELGDAFTNQPTVYRLGMGFDSITRVPLFAPTGGSFRYAGITYDSASDHLWVSDDRRAFEYDMTGTLLSVFDHGARDSTLAYEPSTDTLWFVPTSGQSLYQYDKAGSRLQIVDVVELPYTKFGAEFAIVSRCIADWNNDGRVDSTDLLGFLNAWSSGDVNADINEDGTTDTRDVIAFLSLWASGC